MHPWPCTWGGRRGWSQERAPAAVLRKEETDSVSKSLASRKEPQEVGCAHAVRPRPLGRPGARPAARPARVPRVEGLVRVGIRRLARLPPQWGGPRPVLARALPRSLFLRVPLSPSHRARRVRRPK